MNIEVETCDLRLWRKAMRGASVLHASDSSQIKGVPLGMTVKEVMHLEVEPSTGIMYGQVILEKRPD